MSFTNQEELFLQGFHVKNGIDRVLLAILKKSLSFSEYRWVINLFDSGEMNTDSLVELMVEDLLAYAEKDPASKGRTDLLTETSSSYCSVMHYRVAHQLWLMRSQCSGTDKLALKITENCRRTNGVDIHPAACIGRRFVLDHAYGVVIGETCRIGDDCYILGGVTLGAKGISGNPSGKRHPTLGNNVQVGAFARVLGDVCIGNHVFISPNSVITTDIPAHGNVNIINQIQLQRSGVGSKKQVLSSNEKVQVSGVMRLGDKLLLMCTGLKLCDVQLVDNNYTQTDFAVCKVKSLTSYLFEVSFEFQPQAFQSITPHVLSALPLHLQLADKNHVFTLLNPYGLTELITEHSRKLQGNNNEKYTRSHTTTL
ncbi:serine O-acetyltransferase [Parendozoicomonas sp. Alg238-R29]|uniref:serine O-acetyltransferase n=1 Tax=Parendozoicomonas sp. Alg238-R29 TaxID=2993446 RepID=UPI00248DC4F6|nr:serine O-acetyltransferase [Parendozoicomonas sp. Alg238-R29]